MVEVTTRDYYAAHGKQPRGTGSWAFCPASKYNLTNYLDFTWWFHGCPYATAKRQAQARAKAEGFAGVLVTCS